MTLAGAFSAARRRRLRPEEYSRIAGAIVAFLLLALAARLVANLYLAGFYSALQPGPARLYRVFNVAWCLLFLGSAAPVIAFRGIAAVVLNPRLRLLPVSRHALFGAMFRSSLRGVPVAAPLALASAAALLGGIRAGELPTVAAMLCFAVLFFLGNILLARGLESREGQLELIEVTLLVLLLLANPDPTLSGGRPVVVLFMHFRLDGGWVQLFAFLPAAGGLRTAVMLLAGDLASGLGRSGIRGMQRPGLALYLRRVPIGLFAVSYALELSIILTNASFVTIRRVVITMLALRLLWFIAYLFRTEQRLGLVLRPPSILPARLSVYRNSILLHLSLCAFPPAVLLVRTVLSLG
ncbi:hypothetical protein [Salinispira pacifica]